MQTREGAKDRAVAAGDAKVKAAAGKTVADRA
jgi:hypothetical protein